MEEIKIKFSKDEKELTKIENGETKKFQFVELEFSDSSDCSKCVTKLLQ